MGITKAPSTGSETQATERTLRAVIWIAADPEWDRYAGWCVSYCTRKGYDIVAVVDGRAGGRYDDAWQLTRDGRADVIVTPARDHLPADRLPRIEVVAEERRHLVPQEKFRNGVRPQFLRRHR